MTAAPFQATAIRISFKLVILYPAKDFSPVYHILAEPSTQ